MPVNVSWFDETQKVLYYHFEDPWTTDELIIAINRGNKLSEINPQFNIIYDMRRTESIAEILSLSDFFKNRIQPQVKYRVVVGTFGLSQIFVKTIFAILPIEDTLVLVDTPEEAIEYLQSSQGSCSTHLYK